MGFLCLICQYELQDKYTYDCHLYGKKHAARKAIKETEEKSIFVTNLPERLSRQEILKYFRTYGDIEKYIFEPKYLIVQFKNKEPAEQLLNKPIYLLNIKLSIKQRKIPVKDVKPKKKKEKNEVRALNGLEDLNFENLKKHLEARKDFNSQLQEFLNRVQLREWDIDHEYVGTCCLLKTLFQSIFPNCQTYRFGSTVTGLGFKNCDLDLYFCPDTTVQNGQNSDQGSQAKVFTSLKKYMYSKPYLFAEIVPIPMAKTPIIKFKYLPMKVSCDISIKNSLAVHNSQLVRRYLTINDNLRKAMLIIKYWVSNYELQGGPKLSKYAFTMLFIFYLQQPPLKFPTILELKQSVDKPKFVDFWQINYCDPVVYTKNSVGTSDVTIPELLRGFFEFYSNFDFKKVICPLNGISYKKAIFEQSDQLPDSMNDYKMYLQKNTGKAIAFPVSKAICLQDPFELNHNLGNNMSNVMLRDFRNFCKEAVVICDKVKVCANENLLPLIFSINVKGPVEIKHNIIKIKAKDLVDAGLPKDFEARTDIVDKQKYKINNWYDVVLKLVKRYFEEVLKLEVVVDTEQERKQQKITENSDVHFENKNSIYMKCTGSYNIWNAMKGCNKCLDPALSLLEKEALMSSEHYEDFVNKNAEKIKLNFTCKYERRNKPIHASLCFSNENSTEKQYNDMIAYLQTKLPFVIEKTLMHMKQFKRDP